MSHRSWGTRPWYCLKSLAQFGVRRTKICKGFKAVLYFSNILLECVPWFSVHTRLFTSRTTQFNKIWVVWLVPNCAKGMSLSVMGFAVTKLYLEVRLVQSAHHAVQRSGKTVLNEMRSLALNHYLEIPKYYQFLHMLHKLRNGERFCSGIFAARFVPILMESH